MKIPALTIDQLVLLRDNLKTLMEQDQWDKGLNLSRLCRKLAKLVGVATIVPTHVRRVWAELGIAEPTFAPLRIRRPAAPQVATVVADPAPDARLAKMEADLHSGIELIDESLKNAEAARGALQQEMSVLLTKVQLAFAAFDQRLVLLETQKKVAEERLQRFEQRLVQVERASEGPLKKKR